MKTYKIIAYNLLVIIVLFGMMDFGVNMLLNHPKYIPNQLLPYFKEYYMKYDRVIIQFDDRFSSYNTSLFYLLKPGEFEFENREFNTKYYVNKIGLRDDEESIVQPEIIVLGDSHTMGWGVNQDSTFAQRLEKLTNRKVLNAGISSYGTAREMTLFQQLDTSKLKVLIVQYCENDFIENQKFTTQGKLNISSKQDYRFITEEYKKTISYFPFKHILGLSGIIGENLKYNDGKNTNSSDDRDELDDAALFLKVFQQFENLPTDVQLILFSIDERACNGNFIEGLQASDAFKQLRKKRNITLIDFTTDLSEDHYFILDTHMNDRGHRKVAQRIAISLQL